MADVPLLEPIALPDVLCSGIAAVEYVTDCLRFYFYVLQAPVGCQGPQERIVVAKLVFPSSAVPAQVLAMLAAAGIEVIRGDAGAPGDMVH